jgi:hypothetical protein
MGQDARLSVSSKIGPGCGANIPVAALEQDTTGQLAAASIGISRVHSAGLVTAIDCAPASPQARVMVTVQHCLEFSQVVSDAAAANGLHLATTWKNCQSYTCGREKCAILARSAQRTLVDQFLPHFRELRTKTAAPAPATQSQPTQSQPPVEAAVGIDDAARQPLDFRVAFFVLYLFACLALMVRWHWRSHSR